MRGILKINLLVAILMLSIAGTAWAIDMPDGYFSGGVEGNFYRRQSSYSGIDAVFGQEETRQDGGLYGLTANWAPPELVGKYPNVDMLWGTLFFLESDLSIPGRNGLDINITRNYNSAVRTIGTSGSWNIPASGAEMGKEFLGEGWRFGFERILGDTIYYPNGGAEVLFRDNYDTNRKKTSSFEIIKADTLFRLDGTRVIFGNNHIFGNWGINKIYGGKHAVRIIDACDNEIFIYYHSTTTPLVDSITDDSGHKVWFEYTSLDSLYLLSTRLRKVNYLNSAGNTATIRYVYDDSLDNNWASYNPLEMIIYPNGDTVRYAYTDSAYFPENSSWHHFSTPRLYEVTLPYGGKYAYDWGIYREFNPIDSLHYFHFNVRRIRKTGTGGAVDTIGFDYNYVNGSNFRSNIHFPDGTSRYYEHHKDYYDEEYSGLLEWIKYFNNYQPDTSASTLVGAWWGEANNYWPYGIGTEVQYPNDPVEMYVLNDYYVFHEGYGYAEIYTYNYAFDTHTGTRDSLSFTGNDYYYTRSYTGSNNRAVLTRLDHVSNNVYSTLTQTTDYYWNTAKMKIDSSRVAYGGTGRKTYFKYDTYGNDTLIVKPINDTLHYEFSSSFQYCYPTKAFNSLGTLWKADFHFNTGKKSKEISPNSDTTFYYHDAADRLIKMRRPLETDSSLVKSYARVSGGFADTTKTKITSTGTFQTKIDFYDGFGRLFKTKIIDNDVDSIVTRVEYDFMDRVKRATRAYTSLSDTAWTYYKYDGRGRVVRTNYPDGTRDSLYYDSDASASEAFTQEQIDPLSRKTKLILSSKGELVKALSNDLYTDTLRYEYGPFSRVTAKRDPRGLWTKYAHDPFGDVTLDSTGDEGIRRYYYDARDQLRFIKNADNKWSYRKYDYFGRLKETGTAASIDTTQVNVLSYPSSGQTVQVTYKYDDYSSGFLPADSASNNAEFQLTEVDDESGRLWQYYDARGRLLRARKQIDGLRDTLDVYYTYDRGNQLLTLTYPDSAQASYNYFNSLRPSSIVVGERGTGVTLQGFEYKPWGGLSKIVHCADTSFTTTYTYDVLSLPTKIFTRKGATKKWGRAYYYNDAHMIDTTRQVNDSGTPTDVSTTYGYDYVYRLTAANLYDPNPDKLLYYFYDKSGNRDSTNDDGTARKYHYYTNTNRLSYKAGQGSGNYVYNANGSLDSTVDLGAKYYFDESNRLDSVRVDNYRRYAYYYDHAGRRVKKLFIEGVACDSSEWSIDNSNDKCQHDTGTCWFEPGDVNGNGYCNGIDVVYLNSYLKGGNPPPYPIFRADVNCNGSINGIDATYLLNWLQGGPNAPKCCYWLRTDTTTTFYLYSGDQVIAEIDTGGTLLDKYVYVGSKLIGKFNGTDGKRHYITDIRGSVAAVLPYNGSSVTTSYDYYPFGGVLSITGSEDRRKFIAKELDDGYEVGLYYFEARYYDPMLGRFISPDPVRWNTNPYDYCANNPIMLVDPEGQWPFEDIGAFFGSLFKVRNQQKSGMHETSSNTMPMLDEMLYGSATPNGAYGHSQGIQNKRLAVVWTIAMEGGGAIHDLEALAAMGAGIYINYKTK